MNQAMRQLTSAHTTMLAAALIVALMSLGSTACKDSEDEKEPAAETEERAEERDDDERKPEADSEEPREGEDKDDSDRRKDSDDREDSDGDDDSKKRAKSGDGDSEDDDSEEDDSKEDDSKEDDSKEDDSKDDDRQEGDADEEGEESERARAERAGEVTVIARKSMLRALEHTEDRLQEQAERGELEEKIAESKKRAEQRRGRMRARAEKEKKKEQASSPDWHPAYLEIVTNFSKATVKINGMEYPAYVEDGQEPGVVLPAGGPHQIEVEYDGKSKSYEVYLDPHESRVLMLELSGLKEGSGGKKKRPSPARARRKKQDDDDDGKEQGRITVYSKPKGQVVLDGKKTGDKTPGTIDVDAGRHEVQVEFDDGKTSEEKVARVREGSRIKLFFRDD
ncbi:MAG: PEGA domain-containing protein [Persicimonas sp.]